MLIGQLKQTNNNKKKPPQICPLWKSVENKAVPGHIFELWEEASVSGDNPYMLRDKMQIPCILENQV